MQIIACGNCIFLKVSVCQRCTILPCKLCPSEATSAPFPICLGPHLAPLSFLPPALPPLSPFRDIKVQLCSLCFRFESGRGRAAWESALLQLTRHVYVSNAELADAMLCMLWDMFDTWGLAGEFQTHAEQEDSMTGGPRLAVSVRVMRGWVGRAMLCFAVLCQVIQESHAALSGELCCAAVLSFHAVKEPQCTVEEDSCAIEQSCCAVEGFTLNDRTAMLCFPFMLFLAYRGDF